jgi:hypothetical protein
VADIFTSYRQQKLVHLTLDSGEVLTATEGHPFRTSEGWRDALVLKRGQKLLLKGEHVSKATPYSTVVDVRTEVATVPVFNLEVSNAHTFFVGVDGNSVHNAKPNNGVACPHGGPAHDRWIDKYIDRLKKWTDAKNIRKNQRQVDANGNQLGTNRPDVQFDRKGQHHNREVDTNATNSQNHLNQLNRNDPGAVNKGTVLP